MKNKHRKNTKTQLQPVPVTYGDVLRADAWWAGLSAEDKRFAHELGIVTQAFKGGLAGNIAATTDDCMQAFFKLKKAIEPVYEKGSANWPMAVPGRRGLN